MWPSAVVAEVFVNVTFPKFASGIGVQPSAVQADGASAIHSADATSMLLVLTCLVTDLPDVSSLRETVTAVPLTVTDAEM